jgi:salicylate hydroxylase
VLEHPARRGATVTVQIGIIGSGPAGLTTALALEKATGPAHTQLTLLDRNHSAVDYPGVEYGIQARACHALERLGLKDAALTVGHQEDHIILHLSRTGKDQKRIRVDPNYTYAVERPEFLENLSQLLRRTEILRRHDVTEIVPLDDGRVGLRFDRFTQMAREFDIVIACDGVRSVARAQYFPDAGPIDRGFSAIYFLVEGDANDPRTPESFSDVANGRASEIVLGSFVTGALFPQGRNRLTIALAFDHATRDRLWREHGLSQETPWQAMTAATKAAIAQTLARDTPVHDGLTEQALKLVDDWNSPRVYLWAMHDSDPLPHPYARDCNLVLVGDSCHAFLPTIGMGASLAIEDAEQLGARLGHYLRQLGDTATPTASLADEVFEPWARDRRRIWNDLTRRARAAADNWRGQSERRRFAVAPFVPTRMASAVVGVIETLTEGFHRGLASSRRR